MPLRQDEHSTTTTPVPREEAIGHFWPPDGPHHTESIASALEAISDLLHTTANATRSPATIGIARDGDLVLGGMHAATQRLPQVLSQLAAWAEHIGADASVRHDAFAGDESREMAREDAGEAHELLMSAAGHAEKLARLISTAHSSVSHLHHTD